MATRSRIFRVDEMDAIGVAGKPRLNDIKCKDPLICGLSKHTHTHKSKLFLIRKFCWTMDYLLKLFSFVFLVMMVYCLIDTFSTMNPFHQLPQNMHLRCRNGYLWRCGTRRLQVFGGGESVDVMMFSTISGHSMSEMIRSFEHHRAQLFSSHGTFCHLFGGSPRINGKGAGGKKKHI